MSGPVVITGGGTGGHVFPMRALVDALVARGVSDVDLRYVGSRRGQESDLLGGGRVPLTRLPGRGLQRSWRPRAVVANLRAAGGLVVAAACALVLLRRWRASVVVSVGGYASAAATFAAVWWRIPLVLVEFDAAPGAVHRGVQRYARWRCCAFPSDGDNVIVTGAPVRSALEHIDRSPSALALARARAVPPVEDGRTVVVVMTGSLGSSRVNAAVSELAERWRSRRDCTLIHVTGRRDYERVLARAPRTDGLDYRIEAFGEMSHLWAISDIAVCRAGALTVAELTVLAIPSILVPLPGAPGDHQLKNAESVQRSGGAIVIRDDACTAATLDDRLSTMFDASRRRAMSSAAGSLGRRGAADAIAEVTLGARKTT